MVKPGRLGSSAERDSTPMCRRQRAVLCRRARHESLADAIDALREALEGEDADVAKQAKGALRRLEKPAR